MFQRQNVPTSVKMVAAVCLMFVAINLGDVVFAIATSHEYAPIHITGGLFKVVLFIAGTVGLLNLSEAFRKLMVFMSGVSLITFPIAFLTFAISHDVFLEFAEISVVKSRVAVELILAIMFVVLLWMFITLRRPDVKRAFEPGGQETLAT